MTILACVLIGLFASSLANATKIGKNMKEVCCAIVSMPYNLADGNNRVPGSGNGKWKGLNNFAGQIDKVSNKLLEGIQNITTALSDTTWIASYETDITN